MSFKYNISAPVNEDDCEEDEEEDEDGTKKKEDFESDDPVERKLGVFTKYVKSTHARRGIRTKYFRIIFVKKEIWGIAEKHKVCTLNSKLFTLV